MKATAPVLRIGGTHAFVFATVHYSVSDAAEATPWLDGKHVVFSMNVVSTIESYGTQAGATKAKLVIARRIR